MQQVFNLTAERSPDVRVPWLDSLACVMAEAFSRLSWCDAHSLQFSRRWAHETTLTFIIIIAFLCWADRPLSAESNRAEQEAAVGVAV